MSRLQSFLNDIADGFLDPPVPYDVAKRHHGIGKRALQILIEMGHVSQDPFIDIWNAPISVRAKHILYVQKIHNRQELASAIESGRLSSKNKPFRTGLKTLAELYRWIDRPFYAEKDFEI